MQRRTTGATTTGTSTSSAEGPSTTTAASTTSAAVSSTPHSPAAVVRRNPRSKAANGGSNRGADGAPVRRRKKATSASSASLLRRLWIRALKEARLMWRDEGVLCIVGVVLIAVVILLSVMVVAKLRGLWSVDNSVTTGPSNPARGSRASEGDGENNNSGGLFGRYFQGRSKRYTKPHRNQESHAEELPDPLPWNPHYRIPDASPYVGDRSDAYAKLRQAYDTQHLPVDSQRSLAFLQSLWPDQRREIHPMTIGITHSDHIGTDEAGPPKATPAYDIYNCPDEPPPGYPFQWNLVHDVLHDWPVNEYEIPPKIHQGLCVFDYQTQFDKALHYRELEVPFVAINDPEVARTVERWHQPGYVEQMVGPNVRHRTEHNTNNHFLYHQPTPNRNTRRDANGQKKPLEDLHGRKAELQNPDVVPQLNRMTFREWLDHANVTDPALTGPDAEHWYFRLIGCGYMGNDGSCDKGSTEALFDELPFFSPQTSDTIYLGEGSEQKGIHCRFGMKGVIAENHFDGSRNSIAVLMGRRRYILSHPNQCELLTLLPKGHPSARHSAVDYANPDLKRYPEFGRALANEVVLEPGHVLYLPTNWFHFIVSLELNMQCNTRSGITNHYMQPIRSCGF